MSTIKEIVRPLPGVRQLSLLRQRISFGSSSSFWEKNYRRGETSGAGSYGPLGDAKAEFLNAFVRERNIQSVTEFGCGDGHQLSLADYPRYVGLDVSRAAVALCRTRFSDDLTKSFFLYDGHCFVDRLSVFSAELATSLDVIYHLVENEVFERYMNHLFGAGRLYVIIYSTNAELGGTAPHVRHRRFTPWVERCFPEWQLAQVAQGPSSGVDRADFFVYEKTAEVK